MGSIEHTWGTPSMNRFYQHMQMCAPLTPWGRVLLEKLTVPQLAKNFLTFKGSRKFISTFTRTCHLPICVGAHYYSLYLPPPFMHLSHQKKKKMLSQILAKKSVRSAQNQLITLAADYFLRGPASSSEVRKSMLLQGAG
jgi:hypothetical protein